MTACTKLMSMTHCGNITAVALLYAETRDNAAPGPYSLYSTLGGMYVQCAPGLQAQQTVIMRI